MKTFERDAFIKMLLGGDGEKVMKHILRASNAAMPRRQSLLIFGQTIGGIREFVARKKKYTRTFEIGLSRGCAPACENNLRNFGRRQTKIPGEQHRGLL